MAERADIGRSRAGVSRQGGDPVRDQGRQLGESVTRAITSRQESAEDAITVTSTRNVIEVPITVTGGRVELPSRENHGSSSGMVHAGGGVRGYLS